MSETLNLEKVKEIIEESGEFFLLDNEFKNQLTPLKLKHSCGHEFTRSLKDFKRGKKSCPSCSVYNGVKLTFNEMQRFVASSTQREYKVVSKEQGYQNSRISKLTIVHKTCGHTFPMTFANFKQGKRCPHCAAKSQESKAAQLLKKLFESLKINFEEEKKFDECKNEFFDSHLRFDLFLPDVKILIEIDGEQHFIPVKRFGGEQKLKETQYRDYLKNKFAIESDYRLIRIALYDTATEKKKTFTKVKREIFELLNHVVSIYQKDGLL
jgi:very-short-patch-repair endonuclease